MTPNLPLALDHLPGRVWVAAPHPDDEALGCGALLAALTDAGREVWTLLISDGRQSHPTSLSFSRARLVAERHAEWLAGLAELGVPARQTRTLGLPDGALAECAAETKAGAAAAFEANPPGTLLLPWPRDPHPDHRAVVGPLLRAAAGYVGVRCLAYTVWLHERGEPADYPRPDEAQGLDFDARPWLGRKAAAIAAHRTQLGLITDDPQGFTLPDGLVQRTLGGTETFYELVTAVPGA